MAAPDTEAAEAEGWITGLQAGAAHMTGELLPGSGAMQSARGWHTKAG